MSEIKAISKVGGSPCVFLKKTLLDLYGWEVGETIKVEYTNDKITVTRPVGVKVSKNPRLIAINKKTL